MSLSKAEWERGYLPGMPHGLSQETQAQSLQEKGKSESRTLAPIVSNLLV